MKRSLLFMLLLPLAGQIAAGEADVIDVAVDCDSRCTFHVTVRHADSGWDHYADRWQVLSPDGQLLGDRVLYHPHVNEQPFTRSLSGVEVPAGIEYVIVRAHDSVHAYGGAEKRVALPARR